MGIGIAVATEGEPQSRWDLWLMGLGVVVLIGFWVFEPFLGSRPELKPEPPNTEGRPITNTEPPADWFQGRRGELLQQRLVAFTQYDDDGVTFDLPEERQRLEKWLQKGTNRAALRKNPAAISRFHGLSKKQGGRVARQLQWFPHRVEASAKNPKVFETPFSRQEGTTFERSLLHRHVVGLFTDAELEQGPTKKQAFLLEYVPINVHARALTLNDMDLKRCRAGIDAATNSHVLKYRLKPASAQAYGTVLQRHAGYEAAVILRGYVISAQVLGNTLPGQPQIRMRSQRQVARLIQDIRKLLPPK